MERPYHENLGIGNICFIYSDDAMEHVYEFPLYYSSSNTKWKRALQKIFKQIPNVKESRVVRCVLARLPPNTVIPTHHDTGKWVTASHRVHVAMRTNSDVGFFAGPDNTSMERYFFPTGLPIELNNHAKHSVRNDSSTMYRIHLMLDYVENDLPRKRIQVNLADRVIRHRRHIEIIPRTLSVLKRPIQNFNNLKLFFVIGVMKCGTSSLYEYICQHPKILRARTKETHFFDWKWNQHNEVELIPPPDSRIDLKHLNRVIQSAAADDDDDVDMMMRRNLLLSCFDTTKLLEDDTFATGEATPSYVLYGADVAMRIKSLVPNARIILTVREPVSRAYSHFQMMTGGDEKRQLRNPKSRLAGQRARKLGFQNTMTQDMRKLYECGVQDNGEVNMWKFQRGYMSTRANGHGAHSFMGMYLQCWSAYCSLTLLDVSLGFHTYTHTHTHTLTGRGMYAAQLESWFKYFKQEQILVVPLSELKTFDGVQTHMSRVFRHIGLRPVVVADSSHKNKRHYNPMSDEQARPLRKFFKNHNRVFCDMLKKMKHNECCVRAVEKWTDE
jgi:hypothetical protein